MVRRSNRLMHVQSNKTKTFQELNTTEQEEDIAVFHQMRQKEMKSTPTREIGEPSDIQKQNEIGIEGLVNHPIWRGSIKIPDELVVDGVSAYMSSRAGVEVFDAVQQLPMQLDAKVLCRDNVLPAACFPTADIIDLYILPMDDRNDRALDTFLSVVWRKDVALRVVHAGVSILIFSSVRLPFANSKTTNGTCYLWGVLERPNSSSPCHQEHNSSPFTEYETMVNTAKNPQQHKTSSINQNPLSSSTKETREKNKRKSPCGNPNTPAFSESIGPSLIEMVDTFDQDEEHGDEINSNHTVHPRYAGILSSILEKHGDITRYCWIKCPEILTKALERICETVETLQRMRFVDLRRSHLSSMLSVVTDAEHMKIEVGWLRKRWEELEEAIGELKEDRELKERRKQVEQTAQAVKKALSKRRNKLLKIQSEIEMLEGKDAQLTEEREKLSSGNRNVTSKCSHFCHNSLVDGLL